MSHEHSAVDWSSEKMSEDTFWRIIELFDWKKAGDDDEVMAPAIVALAAMTEADIALFQDIMAEKLHALDTREHARHAYAGTPDPDDGHADTSADDFLYARCAVVASGRELFQVVLAEPLQMPPEVEFEALLFLPTMAHEEKTGEELDHVPPLSFESFSNKEGWKPVVRARPGWFTAWNVPPGNRRPS